MSMFPIHINKSYVFVSRERGFYLSSTEAASHRTVFLPHSQLCSALLTCVFFVLICLNFYILSNDVSKLWKRWQARNGILTRLNHLNLKYERWLKREKKNWKVLQHRSNLILCDDITTFSLLLSPGTYQWEPCFAVCGKVCSYFQACCQLLLKYLS